MVSFAALVICLLFVSWLIIEKRTHERALRSIPLRIMVNGVRGKTTVTKMIARGLSMGGMKVLARTTGDKPSYIVDGVQEEPFKRRGRANIREYLRIVRKAHREKYNTLVVECMAIDSRLQQAVGQYFVKPHLTVFTNVRLDHMEQMGETLEEVALSLSSSLSPETKVILFPGDGAATIAAKGQEEGLEVIWASTDSLPPEIRGEWGIENLSLSLEVCEQAGVDDSPVREKLHEIYRDKRIGAVYIKPGDRSPGFFWLDLFSANDVTSTRLILNDCLEKLSVRPGKVIGIFNTRKDRPCRTSHFIENMCHLPLDNLLITGGAPYLAKRLIEKKDLSMTLIFCKKAQGLIDRLIPLLDEGDLVVGLGNHMGIDSRTAAFFSPS